MPSESTTLAATRAQRAATTVALLADRLPALEGAPSTSGALWQTIPPGPDILGRNDFHALLRSLDGSRLADGTLILRVGDAAQPSRRRVLVRLPAPWSEQHTYLRRFLYRGRQRPPRPISYAAAHRRVTASRGTAAAHPCVDCGEPAAEWSYEGFSPDEQAGFVGDPAVLRAWSTQPDDYAPRCRECHWTFDESGVIWGVGPAPRPRRPAPVPLPAAAPAWVRAIGQATEARWQAPDLRAERVDMLLDRQQWQLAEGDRAGALLTQRERLALPTAYRRPS